MLYWENIILEIYIKNARFFAYNKFSIYKSAG